MMTPRVGGSTGTFRAPDSKAASKHQRKPIIKPDREEEQDNRAKKKKFFQSMKKQEDDTLSELASRYRDRARERRDGLNPDYQSEDPISTLPGYRAVAPDAKSLIDAAARRKQMIEESKYLGGDMEHTHLVKGLDYALLQKVKAEIAEKEQEEAEEQDEEPEQEIDDVELSKNNAKEEMNEEELYKVKSVMANNIMNFLNRKPPERNDLFLPHRMAYVVDLDNECADDIPTTVIRSRADCPNWSKMATLSTNDIVINKLTQILSYLRTSGGKRDKKRDKDKEKDKRQPEITAADVKKEKLMHLEGGLYGEDVGDYVPERKATSAQRDDTRSDAHRDRGSKSSYFEHADDRLPQSGSDLPQIAAASSSDARAHTLVKALTENDPKKRPKVVSGFDASADSYAECYPGAPENEDAVVDSDDEVDYSKMDLGNKKGNVNVSCDIDYII